MINEQISAEENLPKNERQNADWDIRNAPKNYLLLVLAQGGSAFFAFASVWFISKTIGSEGYGGVVAIIAASQVAQILVNWTSHSVARFGTEEFIESAKIARIFWLRLVILSLNFLLVLAASRLWFPPLAEILKLSAGSFWLVILHFAATAFWIHVQYALQGAKLPRIQGFLLMLERLLIFGGITVLFSLHFLNPQSALVCYAVAQILMAFAGIFYLRSYLFAPFSVDWKFVKKILAYSVPLLPFSLVGYFAGSYVDAIFISKFLSTKDLGIYSIATQINGIALQLPTLANSLLLPMFVTLQKESESDKTSNYFRNVLPGLTLFWGVGCAAMSVAGYFAIPLVFGADFQPATLPFWILLTASVISLPVLIGYSALSNSISTTYISMFAAIFAATANIAANFFLIPKYGMAGCAWATVIAYSISVLTFAFLLNRNVKMPFGWVFWAMLPSLGGAIIFSMTENSLISLAVCLVISFLVGYVYRHSLKTMIVFVNNLRRR